LRKKPETRDPSAGSSYKELLQHKTTSHFTMQVHHMRTETKTTKEKQKRTEPVSPILRPLQQFGTIEREELNHLVVAVALHGMDDVEA